MNPLSGAGDAFNAAFIYDWLKDWALIEAAMLANAVRSIKVSWGVGDRFQQGVKSLNSYLGKELI